MKKSFSGNFNSEKELYSVGDTLQNFLRYCDNQVSESSNVQVFLTETDVYFTLEVRVESYDGSLEYERFYSGDEISDGKLKNPFMRLATCICENGHFAELQSTTSEDGYGVNIEVQDGSFTVEHFDQEIRVDYTETLYMFAFESNVSDTWKAIRSFVEKSGAEYYINTSNGDTMSVH